MDYSLYLPISLSTVQSKRLAIFMRFSIDGSNFPFS